MLSFVRRELSSDMGDWEKGWRRSWLYVIITLVLCNVKGNIK